MSDERTNNEQHDGVTAQARQDSLTAFLIGPIGEFYGTEQYEILGEKWRYGLLGRAEKSAKDGGPLVAVTQMYSIRVLFAGLPAWLV